MKCTICGYEFPIFDWEVKETFKEQIARTKKKVRDHYVRDHRDIMIILSLLNENKIRELIIEVRKWKSKMMNDFLKTPFGNCETSEWFKFSMSDLEKLLQSSEFKEKPDIYRGMEETTNE